MGLQFCQLKDKLRPTTAQKSTIDFLFIPVLFKKHTQNMEAFGPREAFKGAPYYFGQIQWHKRNAPVYGKSP